MKVGKVRQWTIERVAEHLGCSRITIYRLLRDEELKFPKPHPRPQGVKANYWDPAKIRVWAKKPEVRILRRKWKPQQ